MSFSPGAFGNPDNLDFYDEFELDAIRTTEGNTTRALREVVRRARRSGRHTTLGLFAADKPIVGIRFPAGAVSRDVWVDPAGAAHLESQPFEDYELLERYAGLWSAKQDLVEVNVEFTKFLVLMRFIDGGHLRREPIAEVEGAPGERLRLGAASPIGRALLSHGPRSEIPQVTLRLEGPTAHDQAAASSRLQAVGNAFLFQFDLVHGGLPRLEELSDDQLRYRTTHRYDRRLTRPLRYPDRALRPEALQLYHHARMLSDEFPLLQFVTYYHVLEFFFPTYSRLVSDEVGRGPRSEKEQLRATIEHCLDLQQLRRFIETHLDRDTRLTLADLLADPRRLPGMRLVRTRTRDGELLQNLVERLYKLRNRIVHAKDGASRRENEDPIFPFSAEAHQLHPEVEVLRFLSVAVLESSASLANRPA